MDTPKRYNPALVTLHWLTVILILGAAFLVPEEGARGSSPIDIHMIFGALLLIVMLARLVVRFTTKRPAWADAGNNFFNWIGELTHIGLYVFTFVILIFGGYIAYQRNLFFYVLGNGAVSFARRGFLGAFHSLGWFVIVLLLLLHVGAALYHQFILKDNLLSRMWFGKA